MGKKIGFLFSWKLASGILVLERFFNSLGSLAIRMLTLPLFLYSWVKSRIIYLLLKNNLSTSLFNKLPPPLAARALYRNRSAVIKKAKILSLLHKKTAWSILLELEKIYKVSFLEILECLDASVLNSYLLLESTSFRKRILYALGRKEDFIDKEDFINIENRQHDSEEVKFYI